MNVRNRMLASLGAAALVVTTSVAAVAAVPTNQADVNVEIKPTENGTVTVVIIEDSANPFDDVHYSLSSQTSNGALDVTTTDNRGTAKGWTVSISATAFARTLHTSVGADIPIGNLALSAGTVSKVAGSGNFPGSVTVPLTMPASSTEIWKADLNEGDGEFTLLLNGALTIPAGALADVYKSTVTVSVNAAP